MYFNNCFVVEVQEGQDQGNVTPRGGSPRKDNSIPIDVTSGSPSSESGLVRRQGSLLQTTIPRQFVSTALKSGDGHHMPASLIATSGKHAVSS